jgi:hypothetical protein
MLTEAEIRKNLEENPYWEPDEDVSDDEWDLYEEIKEKLAQGNKDDEKQSDGDGDGDEDPSWPYDNDDDDY